MRKHQVACKLGFERTPHLADKLMMHSDGSALKVMTKSYREHLSAHCASRFIQRSADAQRQALALRHCPRLSEYRACACVYGLWRP